MLPKIIISFILVLLVGISCSTPEAQEKSTTETQKNTMKGKIVTKSFVNKGGKEIPTFKDLYFETEKETYFIKFMDSKITYEDAKKYVDQWVEIEGEVREGMWDVPDDDPGYAQSRTGYYVVIFSIQ